MKSIKEIPRKHVIVCVNEREDDDCCVDVGGLDLFAYLKEFVRINSLTGSVWITRSKCLGFCNNIGPTIVIYPEGKWFTEIRREDYNEIINLIKY